MLQHRAREGMFYIDGRSCVCCGNSLSWLRLRVYICNVEDISIHVKHLENLRNDGRPEIYIVKILVIEQTKRLTSLAIILKRYHVLMYCV